MSEETHINSTLKARVEISENSMQAYLVLEEPLSETNRITNDEINLLLRDSKITFGIKYSDIVEIYEGQKEGSRFLIAEGNPPIAGKDASFEYFFDTDSSFRPKILEDGRIDYKEVNLVKSIAKDSVLIKKTPATAGVKGKNLFGFELFAINGKNNDIMLGPGVTRDNADLNIIKSLIDGIIFYDDKRRSIEVQKLYVVPKVDYSTGNINVKSSVEVTGDIKPYFTVTTPYSVQIKGLVDNAAITCGGALSVSGGIVGDGKLQIKAGGDIHTAYITNHHVKSGGSIYANTEIRNAIIESDNEVVLVKETGVIIGGKISASNKIVTGIAGNSYYVHTLLEAGVKMEFREKFIQKDNERKTIQKKLDELREELATAKEDTKIDDNQNIRSLMARVEECSALFEKLTRDVKEIEVDYYNVADPVIQINKKVYPGVVIKIKHATFEVKEEMTNVKFKLEGGGVKVSGG